MATRKESSETPPDTRNGRPGYVQSTHDASVRDQSCSQASGAMSCVSCCTVESAPRLSPYLRERESASAGERKSRRERESGGRGSGEWGGVCERAGEQEREMGEQGKRMGV
jgi:hypothetical protein